MAIFFRWTGLYVALGVIFVLVVRDDPGLKVAQMIGSVPALFSQFWHIAGWVAIPLAVIAATRWNRGFRDRVPTIIGAFIACSGISIIFPMVKSALPVVNPFWADPMLATLDRTLHLGADPWTLTHALTLSTTVTDVIYVMLWIIPAVYFPLFLAFFDGDRARINRFSMLYLFVLFFLGNVVAGLFMSVGPVYFDRQLGGAEFAGLATAIQASGIAESATGILHDKLWVAFSRDAQEFGSGISAFPSVHVAMTVVLALYLYELNRKLLPVGVALVAIYQFLSVYLGWHYAVDGYFSIVAVTGAWALTRGFEPKPNVATQLTAT